jgi:hypothetical protein
VRTNCGAQYRIEVVDLLEKPQLAKGDQVIAIPTLVRRLPPPVKKIIGNLSKTESVIVGLDLQPLILSCRGPQPRVLGVQTIQLCTLNSRDVKFLYEVATI